MIKKLILSFCFDPAKSMNAFLAKTPLEKDISMAMLGHTIAQENIRGDQAKGGDQS